MRFLVVASGCALLAACATGAERAALQPVSTVVAAPPAVAVERAAAALSRLGFEVEPASAADLRATRRAGANPAWADCGRVLVVYDQFEQAVLRSWVAPQARAATAQVDAVPAPGGSLVTVSAQLSASYLDWYRNTPFERACPSTGTLERQISQAVATS